MRLCVGVDTDSESVERDVACSRQLCPLAGLQLGFDDWLSGRHVLARHAVRNTDSHRALLSAQFMHATYTCLYRRCVDRVLLALFCNSYSKRLLPITFSSVAIAPKVTLINYTYGTAKLL